jgi:hypothetical protein
VYFSYVCSISDKPELTALCSAFLCSELLLLQQKGNVEIAENCASLMQQPAVALVTLLSL